MNRIYSLLLLLAIGLVSHAQNACIQGHVIDTDSGDHLPYATIAIKGTNIATLSDETGHYSISNLAEKETTVVVRLVGYRAVEKKIDLKSGDNNLNFDIAPSQLLLDEVVVTANRNETKRKEAPVIVAILDQKVFESTSSFNLAEGLNFLSGLRVENNCQNSGFRQVRVNGLEGSYSQTLIDSKPIFNSLTSVYGLEQISANMIERVEVVRGGGSALFGSNAIGGTINIITKEPLNNSFSVSETLSLIDGDSPENIVNMNASLVTPDKVAGIYLFGMFKNRKEWDKDDDGFTELGKLDSNTMGFRSYYKPNTLSKLTLEYHRIKEDRRGGNDLKLPPHQTLLTEMANHHINGGGANYQLFSKDYKHSFNIYTSLQDTKRDTYYGANYQEDAYGKTNSITLASGAQYAYSFDKLWFMPAQITVGTEFNYDNLHDQMLGYNRELKQITRIYGGYLQNEWKNEKYTILVGARLDKHNLMKNIIFSPRVNLRYNPIERLSLRTSYAAGYRAPQTFDEDLHATAVGGAVSFIENEDGLKPEYSHSINLSADYTFDIGSWNFNFVADGFFTKLNHVFVLEEIGADAQGNLLKERRNGSGATVKGVNLELRAVPARWVQMQAGFTLQSSRYSQAEQWSEDESVAPTKRMLRSPDYYGFVSSNFNVTKDFIVSLSGVYTGRMYTPHFIAHEDEDEHYAEVRHIELEHREIKHTKDFFDITLRLAYDIKLTKQITAQVNGGVRNIFNSFQQDFDKGMKRDSGYIYGPGLPRTFFLGVKIGQF